MSSSPDRFEQGDAHNPSQNRVSESSTPIPLPPHTKGGLPSIILELVNRGYEEAYPGAFGTLIPQLRAEDIYVVRGTDALAYSSARSKTTTHPERAGILRRYSESSDLPYAEEDNTLVIGTLPDVPGKPILYPEEAIAQSQKDVAKISHRGFAKAVETVNLTRKFLHEDMHRTASHLITPAEADPISPDDPLLRLAFATDRAVIRHMPENESRRQAILMHEELVRYAKDHDPAVLCDGATIYLYCKDETGQLKIFASAGYDMNEAVVDFLAIEGLPALIRHIKRTSSASVSESLVPSIPNSFSQGRSRHIRDYFREVPGYVNLLRLGSKNDVLSAYAQGDIPRIHALRLPKQDYFS